MLLQRRGDRFLSAACAENGSLERPGAVTARAWLRSTPRPPRCSRMTGFRSPRSTRLLRTTCRPSTKSVATPPSRVRRRWPGGRLCALPLSVAVVCCLVRTAPLRAHARAGAAQQAGRQLQLMQSCKPLLSFARSALHTPCDRLGSGCIPADFLRGVCSSLPQRCGERLQRPPRRRRHRLLHAVRALARLRCARLLLRGDRRRGSTLSRLALRPPSICRARAPASCGARSLCSPSCPPPPPAAAPRPDRIQGAPAARKLDTKADLERQLTKLHGVRSPSAAQPLSRPLPPPAGPAGGGSLRLPSF